MNARSPERAPRVLVIYKKSAYQRYVVERKNRRVERLLEKRDPSVMRLVEAHESHLATIDAAKSALAKLGVRVSLRYLTTRKLADDHDLVVTLGGDGTLLWASHIVGPRTPMLAINTAPRDSVGYFCAASAKDNLARVFSRALSGKLPAKSLTRMQVELDGKVLSKRVLNDALFSHECPAATTRYILRHGKREEEQKSSGIWIGPAAGSTAAQRSAGGKVLPIQSKRLQYVVRELYEGDGRRRHLLKGLVEPGDALVVRSKTPAGKLYLDGPHRIHEVELGGVIVFRRSEEPLTLLGLRSRG